MVETIHMFWFKLHTPTSRHIAKNTTSWTHLHKAQLALDEDVKWFRVLKVQAYCPMTHSYKYLRPLG